MKLDDILVALSGELVRQDQVALVAGANAAELAEDLRARLAAAPPFTQVGPALAAALIASPLVDDLYASDAEILELLTELGR